jgi:hypothetical protein
MLGDIGLEAGEVHVLSHEPAHVLQRIHLKAQMVQWLINQDILLGDSSLLCTAFLHAC